MNRRLEISFQIDEEDLITAMTDIRLALDGSAASTEDAFEVNLLMGKLANTQNRFLVESGYEEDDD